MSALRRLVATSFAVAVVAGLAASAPAVAPTAASSDAVVVAMGPGCCK